MISASSPAGQRRGARRTGARTAQSRRAHRRSVGGIVRDRRSARWFVIPLSLATACLQSRRPNRPAAPAMEAPRKPRGAQRPLMARWRGRPPSASGFPSPEPRKPRHGLGGHGNMAARRRRRAETTSKPWTAPAQSPPEWTDGSHAGRPAQRGAMEARTEELCSDGRPPPGRWRSTAERKPCNYHPSAGRVEPQPNRPDGGGAAIGGLVKAERPAIRSAIHASWRRMAGRVGVIDQVR